MKKHLFTFLFAAMLSFGFSQNSGCNDSNAINFNPQAQQNDGSCIYDPLVLDPSIIIDELPSIVEETSGLIFFNGGLWTHNDSGGQASIYKLDPKTGAILQTIGITNGNNYDIEDITQDDEFIYIGDHGNNRGTRKDLTIYKIKKSDIPETSNADIEAEIIKFSYNDQKSFERKNRNNDYDCESLASFGDHLYVFTKNWVNQETKCYKIPKTPGEYKLDIHDAFNARGLVTSADYNKEKGILLLLGYENFVPFMWLIWDFKDDQFFSGHKRRVDFAYISGAQTEGVCFIDNENIMFSCEDSYYPPRVYQIKAEQIKSADKSKEKYQPFSIKLEPDSKKKTLNIYIAGLKKSKFDVEVYNLRWQKVSQYSFIEDNHSQTVNVSIPIADLGEGIFFVRIEEGKNIGFQKLILKNN